MIQKFVSEPVGNSGDKGLFDLPRRFANKSSGFVQVTGFVHSWLLLQ